MGLDIDFNVFNKDDIKDEYEQAKAKQKPYFVLDYLSYVNKRVGKQLYYRKKHFIWSFFYWDQYKHQDQCDFLILDRNQVDIIEKRLSEIIERGPITEEVYGGINEEDIEEFSMLRQDLNEFVKEVDFDKQVISFSWVS